MIVSQNHYGNKILDVRPLKETMLQILAYIPTGQQTKCLLHWYPITDTTFSFGL